MPKRKAPTGSAKSTTTAVLAPPREALITPFRFLLIVPLLVFWPIIFGGYTFSSNPNAVDVSSGYGGFYNPVHLMDPAGNLLDEPSLALIAENLWHGHVPLLNMRNGMGAPQVESLLTGTLYVLNPVLLALPLNKPLYFDLVIILHVYILLVGLYVFLRFYVSRAPAVVVSMLITFSGITYLHFNAIHYRSAVWMPWMMAGITGVIRDDRVKRNWLILLGATVACGTAGNIQEFFMDMLATCVVAVSAWTISDVRRPARAKLLAASGMLCGVLIASIAFIPFFIAKAQGWVFIPTGVHRSASQYEVAWLFSWLIPRVYGIYPDLFIRNVAFYPHSDYSAFGFLLVVLGGSTGWIAWKMRNRRGAIVVLAPLAVMALGLLKIIHLPIFDFVTQIPLLKDLWYVKYHSYLFLLAAIPSAIGLERALSLPPSDRRKFVRVAVLITGAVAAAAILYLHFSPRYFIRWDMPRPFIYEVLMKWVVNAFVFLCGAAILYFRPRRTEALLIGLITVQCIVMLPLGYGGRKPSYGPSDYTAQAPESSRILALDMPNSNILFHREALGVTDSVTNDRVRMFLWRFFVLANAGTMLQPVLGPDEAINDTQAMALRAAGVDRVFGYAHKTGLIDAGGRVANPLPRAFLISTETYQALRKTIIDKSTVADILSRFDRDLQTLPQPGSFKIVNETVSFTVPERKENTVLVLNQAHSPNWTIAGRKPSLLVELWPAWELPSGSASQLSAVYWPEGLTTGIQVSSFGAALAAAFFLLVVRKSTENDLNRDAGL